MKGKLYLVPSPLGDNDPGEVLPQYVFDSIKTVRHFVVEEIRTARRFLSSVGFRGLIDTLSFYELNEHTPREQVESYVDILLSGEDCALISEAGLPAVADPGAALVSLAHSHDIDVVPFVGPSSLMLALMSSGLNGQNFAFLGYIPAKTEERRPFIRNMEKESRHRNQSQIFIETPYRNDSVLKDLLAVCNDTTRICIAADITLPTAMIRTRTVAQWKKSGMTIGKRPCVFILLA